MKRFVFGISGSSGMPYARRLLETLLEGGHEIHLIVTETARRIWQVENGTALPPEVSDPSRILIHPPDDFERPVASGSFGHDGMVVCPCSMGSLGRIAGGLSTNLLERAADVSLKERRPLILVPRETPLSAIHLENMLRLTRAGATLLPAAPGFYNRPESLEDLVDFIVARILDHMGVEHDLSRRYDGA